MRMGHRARVHQRQQARLHLVKSVDDTEPDMTTGADWAASAWASIEASGVTKSWDEKAPTERTDAVHEGLASYVTRHSVPEGQVDVAKAWFTAEGHAEAASFMNSYEELAKKAGAKVEKIIRREGGKFVIRSEDGKKVLGRFDTKAQAQRRLRQIEFLSRVKKSIDPAALSDDELKTEYSELVKCFEEHSDIIAKSDAIQAMGEMVAELVDRQAVIFNTSGMSDTGREMFTEVRKSIDVPDEMVGVEDSAITPELLQHVDDEALLNLAKQLGELSELFKSADAVEQVLDVGAEFDIDGLADGHIIVDKASDITGELPVYLQYGESLHGVAVVDAERDGEVTKYLVKSWHPFNAPIDINQAADAFNRDELSQSLEAVTKEAATRGVELPDPVVQVAKRMGFVPSYLQDSSKKVPQEALNYRESELPTMKCDRCIFNEIFLDGSPCQLVEGSIEADDVCDGFQAQEVHNTATVPMENPHDLIQGLMAMQPQMKRIIGWVDAPMGELLLFEDGFGHRFSKSLREFMFWTHTKGGWTQEEIEHIAEMGRQPAPAPATLFASADSVDKGGKRRRMKAQVVSKTTTDDGSQSIYKLAFIQGEDLITMDAPTAPTGIDVAEGSVVEVEASDIRKWQSEDVTKYSWMFPVVRKQLDGGTPDSVEVLDQLESEAASIRQKQITSGTLATSGKANPARAKGGGAFDSERRRRKGIPSAGGVKKDFDGDTKDGYKVETPIFKGEDEHIVFGIVMEPDAIDAHGDKTSSQEIRRAAHTYMEFFQQKGFQHGRSKRHAARPKGLRILESYIAPTDMRISGKKIRKGTWLMSMRVDNPAVWKDIKAGLITGFSIEGVARAIEAVRKARVAA